LCGFKNYTNGVHRIQSDSAATSCQGKIIRFPPVVTPVVADSNGNSGSFVVTCFSPPAAVVAPVNKLYHDVIVATTTI